MQPFLRCLIYLAFALVAAPAAFALEVQGIVTSDCRRHVGLVVFADSESVEILDINGQHQVIPQASIDAVSIFNIIDNPIGEIHINEALRFRLKALYTDDTLEPRAFALPVRFIDDLNVFFDLDGKSHVYTFKDIHKIRPAPVSLHGVRKIPYKATTFEFGDSSGKCAGQPGVVKATRVLGDKIAISEFLHGFADGFEALDSFQERTYLYAKPFLYDEKTRLGISLIGKRREPGINFPIYFQWSTGEAYRFQSFTAIGGKSHEFIPNTEPVFSVRSDVKSHFFHALFIGNFVGLPAGQSFFMGSNAELSGALTVQPSFNYMALMGGDYGPYSLSVGFYYPNFGIKVGNEYREILGSKTSYAIRGMYTKSKFRVRAIGSTSSYSSGSAAKTEVIRRTGTGGDQLAPDTFRFSAVFIRGGIDYTWSDVIKVGADLTSVTGSYRETVAAQGNDISFIKLNVQPYVRQTFGHYVSITAYANFFNDKYRANFLNQGTSDQDRGTEFFGAFEFIF